VALNKSSLVLNIILQNTQTLQLFTNIINAESIAKVIKIPSWKAWVERPNGLIIKGRKRKRF